MMRTTKMMTIWKKFLLLGCFFGVSVNGLWGDDLLPGRLEKKESGLTAPLASDAVLASVVYGALRIMELADPDFKTNLKANVEQVVSNCDVEGKIEQLLKSDNDLEFALGLIALSLIINPDADDPNDDEGTKKVFDGFGKNIQAALQHAFNIPEPKK
ncbi:MAG: hypothetical protein LW808_000735 [Verrucomicrobiota bacterium]|nr:MAG: hypothetical protein LW808_000735 [Verrucomicrobiota bacterium]